MQKNFTVVTFTTKYTYYYHAFHWDISLRRSVPHSSIIAFLPFFCYHHLIRAQMLSLAWNERIQSHLHEWSKTYLRPRAAQNCILAYFRLFAKRNISSEQRGSGVRTRGTHADFGTGYFGADVSMQPPEDHPAVILPTTAQARNLPKRREKSPRASTEKRERIAQMRLVGQC